jgi:hypothetical protein
MAGSSMGKLTVLLQVANRSQVYWRFGEDIGRQWQAGQVSLPFVDFKEQTQFNIVFKAESGGLSSDIGLDDVKVEAGECAGFGSCTFENADLCAWANVLDELDFAGNVVKKRDVFDWEFGSGSTGNPNSGPR